MTKRQISGIGWFLSFGFSLVSLLPVLSIREVGVNSLFAGVLVATIMFRFGYWILVEHDW